MRLTVVLCRQHLGYHFKRNWLFQRAVRPHDTKCEETLQEKGYTVLEANQYIKDLQTQQKQKNLNFRIQVVGFFDKPALYDETHPEYHKEPCMVLKDKHVLLEGLKQAQAVIKTHVVTTQSLPQKIEEAAQQEHPEEVHNQMKNIILFSNIFDCEQKKLAKIRDPEKPMYVFPRILGITDVRRNVLTTSKILNLLDKTSPDIAMNTHCARNVTSKSTFKKDDDVYQFTLNTDSLITSNKPTPAVNADCEELTLNQDLPSLYPMSHKISFQLENFYRHEDIYPMKEKSCKYYHPNMAFLHYNPTIVHNLHQSPVQIDQLWGRSLLHGFTVASSYAKSIYGADVQSLPQPVTLQCVQTDGCNFYLGVFQLNTLDLDGDKGLKNLWYQAPVMKMFETCKYLDGRPHFEGYNPTVYNYLSAMYSSI